MPLNWPCASGAVAILNCEVSPVSAKAADKPPFVPVLRKKKVLLKGAPKGVSAPKFLLAGVSATTAS